MCLFSFCKCYCETVVTQVGVLLTEPGEQAFPCECGTLCTLMTQTSPSKESFEYVMALQKTRPLLNGSRPVQYLTRTVGYVHLKIRAADVKTNCSLFSIGNLHRHSGTRFTSKLGIYYLWSEKAVIATRRCQARSWCLSKALLPLPREWLCAKSMEPAGSHSGGGCWGLSTCWISPDEGKGQWDQYFPFLTVGIWGSCEKYVLESIPPPLSVRDGNLQ